MGVQEIIIAPYNPAKTGDAVAYTIAKQYAIQQIGGALYKAGMPQPEIPDYIDLGVGQSLGNKVFSNLEIDAKSFRDVPGYEGFVDSLIFDTALFTVRNNKNIVVTPVQGRNGTVKEYISGGDSVISIRGVIAGKRGIYPMQGTTVNGKEVNSVEKFIKAMNAPVAIDVNSWYLNMLGIYSMVVTSFELPQTQGMYETQFFEIEALSDEPFIIDLR
jgi:Domain of unknown function (DUF6046)